MYRLLRGRADHVSPKISGGSNQKFDPMSKLSIRKGKTGEREAAKRTGGVRTWEHLHDLYAYFRWWEVKRTADGFTKVYAALEEHAEHYEETGDGPVPSALIRQDRKPWIVAFYLDDWEAGLTETAPERKNDADISFERQD